MKKEVLVGILAALGTAAILWVVNMVGLIPNMVSVPSGAVISFELDDCPGSAWEEYKAAHGRFIRGIDRSGSGVDPDGERNPGSMQEDMLASHAHVYRAPRHYGSGAGDHARAKPDGSDSTNPAGGTETRPKNVALLYCKKK